MKQYKIFKHPTGTIEAVKQGWSWPAFCFGSIWALIKKLWLVGGGIIIGSILIVVIADIVTKNENTSNVMINVIGIAVGVFLGINGNALRESNLISRGFRQVGGVVTAANPEAAIALI